MPEESTVPGAPTTAADQSTPSAAPAEPSSSEAAKAVSGASTRELLDAMEEADSEDTELEAKAAKDTEAATKTDKPEKKEESADDAPDLEALADYDFVKRVDPELLKDRSIVDYLKQQEDGHRKLITQTKAERERMGSWSTWADALSTPETAAEAYKQLGERLEASGVIPKATAGATRAAPADFDWTEHFETEADYKAFEKAAGALFGPKIASLEAELARTKQFQEQTVQERSAATNEAVYGQWLSANAPKIIEIMQRDDQGFTPTAEQIDKAVRTFPQIAATDPVRAVKAFLADERARHYAGVGREKLPKGPETPEAATNSDTTKFQKDMTSRALLDLPMNA